MKNSLEEMHYLKCILCLRQTMQNKYCKNIDQTFQDKTLTDYNQNADEFHQNCYRIIAFLYLELFHNADCRKRKIFSCILISQTKIMSIILIWF